jgi:hypothetical protein
MRISGFSFARNATLLYYPVAQAVASILPLVDEFVFALGEGDPADRTREALEALGSPKLRILDTRWDLEAFPRGMVHAQQTDLAKAQCSGDWLFYLQADEVIHERYLPLIRQRCEALLDRPDVEGLLFGYKHFWGDYAHYHRSHGWYKHEIRIVRNHPEIHSWESAQSFRRIPGFDGRSYRQQEGTHKLRVADSGAEVYHYGWVRPPRYMKSKTQALDTIHQGAAAAEARVAPLPFDYGDLSKLPRFTESHPAVMQDWIARFDWQDELNYGQRPRSAYPLHKHEKPKYRLLSSLENLLGVEIGGFRNYVRVRA